MFSTVPKHKLRKAQEKFYRLNENMVPHLIAAFKSLQYNKGFYPMPDLVKQLKIERICSFVEDLQDWSIYS